MSWVIIEKNALTKKMRNSFREVKLLSGQLLIRVSEENEEYFKDYIKYDKAELDSLDLASTTKHPSKLVDPSTVISYPSPFAIKNLPMGEKLFKRKHGMGALELDAGETGHFEFEIPYTWAVVESLELMGMSDDVQADLFIEDNDIGLYSGSGVSRYELNQFGYDVEIPNNFYKSESKFPADLYLGMWVVLQITNTGTTTQKIRANIELNEVRQ